MGITVQKLPYVSDLATFRSSEPLAYGTVVFLQGTTAPSDGGEAWYQVSLTDKTSVDNGGNCIVDLAGYRWFQATLSESTGGILPISEGGTNASTQVGALDNLFIQGANIASATTTDLSASTGQFVIVSGSVTITAFGTLAAGNIRFVKFSGAPLLTYNSSSLILPGQANIQAAAGDTAIMLSLGSGNWQCLEYTQIAGGSPGTLPISEGGTGKTTAGAAFDALFAQATNVVAATTTPIGAATGPSVTVTGNTTITAFDTAAIGIQRWVKFTGTPLLTYDGTVLILPTAASIQAAANDFGLFHSLGSGNWICLVYQPASGQPVATVSVAKGGTGQTTSVAAFNALQAKGADIASATTTDLSTATGPFVNITGNTTITAFGTVAAGTQIELRFTGTPLLTYNVTSLILPTSANIQAAAGDAALMESLGSGNWRCLSYQPFNGLPITTVSIAKGGTGQTTSVAGFDALDAKGADIASATTTDLSTATGPFVNITGSVTITSLGTVAAGTQRELRFTGAPLLTYNAASLILPSSANIQAAAGDTALMESLGSGNWRCLNYQTFAATPLIAVPILKGGTGLASSASALTPTRQFFTASGTYTSPTGLTSAIVYARGAGGGGGGVSSAAVRLGAGGGGQGSLSIRLLTAAQIGSTQTVTLNAGGTAGANTGGAGGAGGTSTFGSLVTANGGGGGSGVSAIGASTGGAGGSAGTGDIAIPGCPGSNGFGVTAIDDYGGFGGGEGGGTNTNGNAAGNNGSMGGGASGAASAGSTAAIGGVGGKGWILVIEFYT